MSKAAAQKRRMRLLNRQLTLATIARREAMAALAHAVSEEQRSADLSERSRSLIDHYAQQRGVPAGAALRDRSAFVGALQNLSDEADQARRDAGDQAQWQRQSLAAAERRAERFTEHMRSTRRSIEEAQEQRDQGADAQMARKLLR